MDDRQNSLPFGRLSVAVAGAAALVALSVGGAIAANSDDGPSAEPSVSTTLPPEGGTDGGTVGGSGGTDGGGGNDPSPTATSPDEPPVTDEPSAPSELAELNRRIAELEKKVDELPTKKELADALRAFADQLDKPAAPGDPGQTHEPTDEPTNGPQPTDSLPPNQA
ncbi:hypothetical protein M2158_003923 [Streptomyces sp. SAI-144]|uniref:hypothetical protein n=1 Tax=Streptomyces sp. SAI-144 TaxID=2940544 RepID=UPI002475EB31|nr:hypothetical protein [Streptomyces sp. SAI-144]MDH6435446.1 hypothetical protein [Streptomyces sp. SAI-144]